jgi:hypothetical protein
VLGQTATAKKSNEKMAIALLLLTLAYVQPHLTRSLEKRRYQGAPPHRRNFRQLPGSTAWAHMSFMRLLCVTFHCVSRLPLTLSNQGLNSSASTTSGASS